MAINSIDIKDGNGATKKLSTTVDSNDIISSLTSSKKFELDVNMGRVPGYSFLDKFGVNPLITTTSDPEDVWEFGGLYTYDADGTAPIVSLVSTAADTQPIKVTGLDINGDEVEQEITLTGTTRVALSTPLWRVYRMENEGTADLTGIVKCYVGTSDTPIDADVRAIIDNGHNQTLMALYTIPKGKVGFLYRGELGIKFQGSISAGNNFANCSYYSRRYGKVFKIKKSISLVTNATALFQDVRSAPDTIPSLTDIRMTIEEVSEDAGAWGTLDILLVDETEFPTSYLQAIGQPGY